MLTQRVRALEFIFYLSTCQGKCADAGLLPVRQPVADILIQTVGQQPQGLAQLLCREVCQHVQVDVQHPAIGYQSQCLPFFTSLSLEVEMPVRLRIASLVSRWLSINTSCWSQQMNRPMPACTQGLSWKFFI